MPLSPSSIIWHKNREGNVRIIKRCGITGVSLLLVQNHETQISAAHGDDKSGSHILTQYTAPEALYEHTNKLKSLT